MSADAAEALQTQQVALDDAVLHNYGTVNGGIRETPDPEAPDAEASADIISDSVPRSVDIFLALFFLLAISLASTAASEADLIYFLVCHSLNVPSDSCYENAESSRAVAQFNGIVAATDGIGNILSAPYMLHVSDRVGRKPIFLVALSLLTVGRGLEYLLNFTRSTLPNYWWMLVPKVVTAMSGGLPLLLSLAVSYIADLVHNPVQRINRVSVIDAVFAASIASGPLLGSVVRRHVGLARLYLYSVLSLCALILITSGALTESLNPEYRARNQHKEWRVRDFAETFSFWHLNPIDRVNARISLLIAVGIAIVPLSTAFVLLIYMRQVFQWSGIEIGYLLGFTFGWRAFICLVCLPLILPLLAKRWQVMPNGVDKLDLRVIRLGLGTLATGYTLMGFATTPAVFVLTMSIEVTGYIASPVAKNTLIKYIPPDKIGSFFALFSVLVSAAEIFMPIILLQMYRLTLEWWPGLTLSVAGLMFAGLLAISFLFRY